MCRRMHVRWACYAFLDPYFEYLLMVQYHVARATTSWHTIQYSCRPTHKLPFFGEDESHFHAKHFFFKQVQHSISHQRVYRSVFAAVSNTTAINRRLTRISGGCDWNGFAERGFSPFIQSVWPFRRKRALVKSDRKCDRNSGERVRVRRSIDVILYFTLKHPKPAYKLLPHFNDIMVNYYSFISIRVIAIHRPSIQSVIHRAFVRGHLRPFAELFYSQ